MLLHVPAAPSSCFIHYPAQPKGRAPMLHDQHRSRRSRVPLPAWICCSEPPRVGTHPWCRAAAPRMSGAGRPAAPQEGQGCAHTHTALRVRAHTHLRACAHAAPGAPTLPAPSPPRCRVLPGPPSPAGTRRGFRGQPGNSWRGVPAGQTGQDGQEQSSSSLKTPCVCVCWLPGRIVWGLRCAFSQASAFSPASSSREADG